MARGPEQQRDRRRSDRRDRNAEERADSDIVEKLVHINRVAATVKGGRRFSFAALMVVGDQKGRVGFGHGKAREVPEAIRKATEEAKKTMIRVPLRESRTLHHDGQGRWGAGKIMMRAAPPGTGVIAGGPMRAVLETLGVQDVVGKSVGSSNPYNMIRATFEALKVQASPRQVAAKRGKKVADIIGRRADGAGEAAEARRLEAMAKVTVRQTGSPIRRKGPARDAGRPRPQPHRPHRRPGGHPLRARHDRQGRPHGRGGGVAGSSAPLHGEAAGGGTAKRASGASGPSGFPFPGRGRRTKAESGFARRRTPRRRRQ
jgi:small subunit ribosomal protein S5